jgi:hypothetical protein
MQNLTIFTIPSCLSTGRRLYADQRCTGTRYLQNELHLQDLYIQAKQGIALCRIHPYLSFFSRERRHFSHDDPKPFDLKKL